MRPFYFTIYYELDHKPGKSILADTRELLAENDGNFPAYVRAAVGNPTTASAVLTTSCHLPFARHERVAVQADATRGISLSNRSRNPPVSRLARRLSGDLLATRRA